MAKSDRYRFGDILLPEAESLARTIPTLLRQQQANEMDREKIALENKRIEAAKQQNDRLFQSQENARAQSAERYKEEFAFKKDQAKQLEMNRLVASVEEPYQKAIIYKKYGLNDLAENFTTMGDKQEAQKDILKEFHSFTDPNEILKNSSTALSGLDPTSSAATSVREARQQAIDDLDVKYSELLEMPGFRLVHEKYTQGMKDLTMSEENKKLLSEAYVKALGKYGAVNMTGIKEDGSSSEDFTASEVITKDLSVDEQADQLVTSILDGDAFKPEGALEFLSTEERQSAVEEAKPIQSQFKSVSSKLAGLQKQRQSKYDQLESKKNELSKLAKEVKYYNRTGNKERRKQASREYRTLQSSIKTLSAEVSKLKQSQTGLGNPTKFDKSLGAEISRLSMELGSLKRQGNRLSGQPTYGR